LKGYIIADQSTSDLHCKNNTCVLPRLFSQAADFIEKHHPEGLTSLGFLQNSFVEALHERDWRFLVLEGV
jgi:hypothetical protein